MAAEQGLVIILMSLVVHRVAQTRPDVPAVRQLFRMAAAELVRNVNLAATRLLLTGVPSTQLVTVIVVRMEL